MSLNFKDKYHHINKITCDKLKVKASDYDELEDLYVRMYKVLNNPTLSVDPVEFVKECEYRLQEIYNFKKDSDKHSYWHRLHGCTCPSMDNGGYWGTSMRIYAADCPFHGGFLKDKIGDIK